MKLIFRICLAAFISFGAMMVIHSCCSQPGYTTAVANEKPLKKIDIESAHSEWAKTYHVKESNMHYVVKVYTGSGGIVIINLTKDSLEVESLKKQFQKDSLQVEVFKKYLKQ